MTANTMSDTVTDEVSTVVAGRGRLGTTLEFVRTYLTFVLLGVLLLVAGTLSPSFLSVDNLISVAYGSAVLGVVALGQTMLLVTGNFDLSVAGVVGASGICTLLTLPTLGTVGAIGVGLAAGLLVGLLNGVIVAVTGANPFLVTLGMLSLLYGAGLVITQSRTLYAHNESFKVIGQGRIGMLPIALLIFLVLAVLLQLILSRTNAGRQLFYIGLNREASRLSGIPVNRLLLAAFALSGLMAALGGILMASRLNSITANAGLGYEFLTVTAAVVGGTSLFGGRGGTLRTVVGIFVLGALDNVLILLGASFSTSGIIRGIVFLLVVGIDGLSRKEQKV
jgi:ribose transport system permease protein